MGETFLIASDLVWWLLLKQKLYFSTLRIVIYKVLYALSNMAFSSFFFSSALRVFFLSIGLMSLWLWLCFCFILVLNFGWLNTYNRWNNACMCTSIQSWTDQNTNEPIALDAMTSETPNEWTRSFCNEIFQHLNSNSKMKFFKTNFRFFL